MEAVLLAMQHCIDEVEVVPVTVEDLCLLEQTSIWRLKFCTSPLQREVDGTAKAVILLDL